MMLRLAALAAGPVLAVPAMAGASTGSRGQAQDPSLRKRRRKLPTLPDIPGLPPRVRQGVEAPSYWLEAKFPADTPPLPYTITGPDHCRGSGSGLFPIFGRLFLNTLVTQRSASTQLAGGVTAPIFGAMLRWSWSLAPQSS